MSACNAGVLGHKWLYFTSNPATNSSLNPVLPWICGIATQHEHAECTAVALLFSVWIYVIFGAFPIFFCPELKEIRNFLFLFTRVSAPISATFLYAGNTAPLRVHSASIYMIFGALALNLQAVHGEILHFLCFAIALYGCLILMPMTLDYHKRKLRWTQKSCSQVRQSWICRSGGSSLTGCLTIGKTNLRTLRNAPKIQLFCVWMTVQGPETSVSEHH